MIRHLILFSLPFTVLLTFSYPVKGEIFIESGLVDIPTGDVLKHGIFGAGVHATFQNTSHLPRDAVAFRLNFGMFDRVEMGMSQLLLQDKYFSRYALAHLKTLLVAESGMIPSVSIGIENIGDKVSHEWNTYQPQS